MNPEHDEFDLPPKFTQRLREAYSHDVAVSAATDAAVLGLARAKFDRRRRVRMTIRWGAAAASALAAAIVLAVVLNRPGDGAKAAVAKGDVNADGVVNMVDALALARHVRAGDKVDKAWDVNGDGVIDGKDADAIAVAAVSLKQGGQVAAARGLPKLKELGIDRAATFAVRNAPEARAMARATQGESGSSLEAPSPAWGGSSGSTEVRR